MTNTYSYIYAVIQQKLLSAALLAYVAFAFAAALHPCLSLWLHLCSANSPVPSGRLLTCSMAASAGTSKQMAPRKGGKLRDAQVGGGQ